MTQSTTVEVPSPKSKRLAVLVLFGALFVGAGIGLRSWIRTAFDSADPVPTQSRLVESEGLILELTPRLKELLNTSVLNLSLPDVLGVELFAEQVTIRDITSDSPQNVKQLPALEIVKSSWSVADSSVSVSAEECSLWSPLFQSIDYFERAGFKFVTSHFDDADPQLLHSEIAFEGLARDSNGRRILVKAIQSVSWRADSEAGGQAQDESLEVWQIVEWTQKSLETIQANQPLFSEALDRVIPDAELRARLRNSIHEGYILDRHASLVNHEEPKDPHPNFSGVSQDRHPSLAVVDIDRDGLDDIYVMARWGKNILLHNKGGYFEDVAPQYGLDIDGHCSSAIFADFDNDGDVDLMLGRTLVPSQYLVNESGHFVDRSDTLVEGALPALVTSVSAADYNGDGLLDVYLSTYAANMQNDEIRGDGPPLENPSPDTLLSKFLPDETARELNHKIGNVDNHRHLNYYGPPNLLLINRGGRFETAPENEQVTLWRHTYQASWSDYDQDGDPDLYLANDFAVNSLMRNDGEAGFVDVAKESGTTDIGFGMGASWGDYDNDGRVDLYVSNMFSKAGRRITGSLQNIDERFEKMARGNSLFRNAEDGFQKVSGLDASTLQVEKAGWSWSGQFVDFDNDGWLDVHALSGYYTAPPEIAVQVDL